MRFSLKHHGQLSCVEHCPEGEYVLHSDYARLKTEVERLTAIIGADAIDREHGMCCDASAQVERLTKAGDAMAEDLIGEFGSCNSVYDWNAAKEGKQS
jgi:hypothetical protein